MKDTNLSIFAYLLHMDIIIWGKNNEVQYVCSSMEVLDVFVTGAV